MSISVKVTAHNSISRYAAKLRPGAARAVERWAQATFERAQALVPVDTGELRDSGSAETSATAGGVVGRVGYDAPHAAHVHNGTERSPAQPWLLSAFNSTRKQLLEEMARTAAHEKL